MSALTDRERALAGPRVLKVEGSPEWCWQTVVYLKDSIRHVEDKDSIRHVEEQWRQADEVLAELRRVKAWQVIPPGKPYGSLDAMLSAELGEEERAIRARIAEAAMSNAELAKVDKAQNLAEPSTGGGDRRSKRYRTTVDNVHSGRPHGNSRERALRQLRHAEERGVPDAAELRAEVLAEQRSPHRPR